MDKKKFAKLQLRTNKAFGIEITAEKLDSRYKVVVNDAPVTTETGDLRLFSIEPSQPGLPSFSGRWDHHQNTVDIDPIRNGVVERRAFRGHHTDNHFPGVYGINIHVPEGAISLARSSWELSWACC